MRINLRKQYSNKLSQNKTHNKLHCICSLSPDLGVRISIKNNYPISSTSFYRSMFLRLQIICPLCHILFKQIFTTVIFLHFEILINSGQAPYLQHQGCRFSICPSANCGSGLLVCLAWPVSGQALPACFLHRISVWTQQRDF